MSDFIGQLGEVALAAGQAVPWLLAYVLLILLLMLLWRGAARLLGRLRKRRVQVFTVLLGVAALASAAWMAHLASRPGDPSRAYYGTDVRALRPRLEAAVATVPRVLAEPGPAVTIEAFAADGPERQRYLDAFRRSVRSLKPNVAAQKPAK